MLKLFTHTQVTDWQKGEKEPPLQKKNQMDNTSDDYLRVESNMINLHSFATHIIYLELDQM